MKLDWLSKNAKEIEAFPEHFQAWVSDLLPQDSKGKVRFQDNLEAFKRPGVSGFFNLLVGLAWWGQVVSQTDDMDSRKAWKKEVVRVRRCLSCLRNVDPDAMEDPPSSRRSISMSGPRGTPVSVVIRKTTKRSASRATADSPVKGKGKASASRRQASPDVEEGPSSRPSKRKSAARAPESEDEGPRAGPSKPKGRNAKKAK